MKTQDELVQEAQALCHQFDTVLANAGPRTVRQIHETAGKCGSCGGRGNFLKPVSLFRVERTTCTECNGTGAAQ